MEPMTFPKRPVGVTMVAMLMFAQALIRGIFGILGIILFILPGWTTLGTGARLTAGVVGALALALALLLGAVAWGLLDMQRWAYWPTVIIEACNLALGIFEMTQPHPSPGAVIGGIIFPVLILIYFLLDGNTRKAFGV